MFVLGIETSCDETSAAVLKEDKTICSNIVLSQDEIHSSYGGVVPELASRQHITSIGYVVEESLTQAGAKIGEIDVFAATQGPGLIGSLLVGLSFAKGLAYSFQKPLVPVDHLEAHVHAAFIENEGIVLPALALLVSGGHTSLFFLEEKLSCKLIGKTRDDAAGEALDKIAKFLELGYPGGPVIDKMAEKGKTGEFSFSLPQMSDGSLDFSFSGFKTSALRQIRKHGIEKGHPKLKDFLASFEEAVIRALITNLARAIDAFHPASTILCGGVARNRKLRKKFLNFSVERGLRPFIPSPKLCTDNAAMIAALALEKVKSGKATFAKWELNAYPRF